MLRQLFGPSKEVIWQQFAEQLQGHFVNGGFFGQDKVEVQHENWFITLDTKTVSTSKATVVYTRLRAPFVNKDNFEFSISRRNIFKDIGKLFGMQDIEVGYPDFDAEFIIKANDVHKVKALFSNATLRQLIQEQPHIHFGIREDDRLFARRLPADVSLLYFKVLGVIKDLDRLKALYLLFAETLNQLCRLDPACKQDPQVRL